MIVADWEEKLVTGLVALRLNFITTSQFRSGITSWLDDRETPIEQFLVDQGALQPDQLAVLERIVAEDFELRGLTTRAPTDLSTIGIETRFETLPNDQLLHEGRPGPETSPLTYSETASTIERTRGSEPEAGSDRVFGYSDRRFEILRPHAKGGIGEIFVARDRELGRDVALKEIRTEHSLSTNVRSRFLLEAEINGNLEHPNIVPIYSLGTSEDGRPFYAMRFIQGESLKETIDRFHQQRSSRDFSKTSLELRELLNRLIDVCHAIAYAHSRGVLHRDLKPSNIMLGNYGETLIIDWGLAKPIGSTERVETEISPDDPLLFRPKASDLLEATSVGTVLGTPAMMSPEQAEGRLAELGPTTDIYSLGATLSNLLTGDPPVTGRSVKEILEKVGRGEITRPRSLLSSIPKALEAITLKAMAFKPEDRYQSAIDLAQDLEHFLADQAISAAPDPWITRLFRWIRTHRMISIICAQILVVATLGFSVATFVVAQKNAELHEAHRLTDQARELAQQRLNLAITSMDQCFETVEVALDSADEQTKEVQKQLLKEPQGFFEKLIEGLSETGSPTPRELFLRATGELSLARISQRLGQDEVALQKSKIAVDGFEKLIEADPDVLENQEGFALSLSTMGIALSANGHPSEAIEALERSILTSQDLMQKHPEDPKLPFILARSRQCLRSLRSFKDE